MRYPLAASFDNSTFLGVIIFRNKITIYIIIKCIKKKHTVYSKSLLRLLVLCVSCCDKCSFVYGPFCHGAIRLDNIYNIYNMYNILSEHLFNLYYSYYKYGANFTYKGCVKRKSLPVNLSN